MMKIIEDIPEISLAVDSHCRSSGLSTM